jgi:hypothetical protein
VAAEQSGFDVSSHHTVFSGRCPVCKSAGIRVNGDRQLSRRLSDSGLISPGATSAN